MTTEAHLDKLYALVREQSEQIDALLLSNDDLKERVEFLEEIDPKFLVERIRRAVGWYDARDGGLLQSPSQKSAEGGSVMAPLNSSSLWP